MKNLTGIICYEMVINGDREMLAKPDGDYVKFSDDKDIKKLPKVVYVECVHCGFHRRVDTLNHLVHPCNGCEALGGEAEIPALHNTSIKKFSKTIEQVIEEVRGELESPNFHWEFVVREVYDILERELPNA